MPNFLEILGPGVISVSKAIKTGLINPKPIPAKIFAITKTVNEKENDAMIIPTPKTDNPKRIMGKRPLTSEMAPENS